MYKVLLYTLSYNIQPVSLIYRTHYDSAEIQYVEPIEN